jgi:pSer/pThr/pTyr-binding forkhead associated (FHA) protein
MNGTFVNGKRLTVSHPLESGDLLALGKLKFRVRIVSPLESDETKETEEDWGPSPEQLAAADDTASVGSPGKSGGCRVCRPG